MKNYPWGPLVLSLRILPIILFSTIVFTGCIKSESHPLNMETLGATVEMTNTLTFQPDTLRIKAGTVVDFKNASMLVHTVTADPEIATLAESVLLPEGAKPFNSGNLNPDDTFQHKFEVTGTYRYFCIPHEGAKMRGTVIVE